MSEAFRITPRPEWGARYGRGAKVALPWGEVVFHTEAGAVRDEDWPAVTAAATLLSLTEAQHMRAIESYHVNTRGWQGIGYSFVIFEDGTICEGRGWGRAGGHTETRNSTAAGICFTGHGDLQPATEAQWLAAAWLIGEGIRIGALTPNPKITGHRNYSTKGKTCPGNLIYPHLARLRGITGHEEDDLTPDERKALFDIRAMLEPLATKKMTAALATLPTTSRATVERTTTATYEMVRRIEAGVKTLLARDLRQIVVDAIGAGGANVNAEVVADAVAKRFGEALDELADSLTQPAV